MRKKQHEIITRERDILSDLFRENPELDLKEFIDIYYKNDFVDFFADSQITDSELSQLILERIQHP